MKEDIASAVRLDSPEPEILTQSLAQLQISVTSKTKKKVGRKQKAYVPGGRVVTCDYVCPDTGDPCTNVYKDYFKDPPNCENIVTAQRNYEKHHRDTHEVRACEDCGMAFDGYQKKFWHREQQHGGGGKAKAATKRKREIVKDEETDPESKPN